MSELEKADNPSEVYVLDTNEHSVSTAKSQFAEEYDVPYSEVSEQALRSDQWE